jgi:hypothetical protein
MSGRAVAQKCAVQGRASVATYGARRLQSQGASELNSGCGVLVVEPPVP